MARDDDSCSARSLRREEGVQATASRVRRWLVIEQPGPWGPNALLESRMDPAVARSLHGQARRHGVRVLLARRPGWRHEVRPRRVHFAHTSPEGGWLERLDVDSEQALVRLDLSRLESLDPPGLGDRVDAPVVLVCTNGRHDQCCANLGRPVVRALVESGVPDVWECSHVGGDRFAANVVSLPSGVYLGRVPPDRAAAIVRELVAGVIDLAHFRGRSCYPTLVQAAEIAARTELGERRLDALVLEQSTSDRPELVRARFRHGADSIEVTVRRRAGSPVRLTCGDGTGRPWTYEVVEVRRGR